MALLSVIRPCHFHEGMPIREISRGIGLFRKTVRKYLGSGVVEPRYLRRKDLSKLDDCELTLTWPAPAQRGKVRLQGPWPGRIRMWEADQ